ncbi:MAG: nucleotide kinase domain-containing protein [Sphaerospermopsis kisseleviana]
MQVRQEIFDTYWRFAAMRQEVFFNKLKNVPLPWTTDPILNTYKFCNAYRVSDRVSQYLIKNVIYDENRSKNEEEVLFRILLFKIFNKIETWEYLESKIGNYITLSNFDLDVYSNILQESMDLGYVIYTSAYMSCASKKFGYDKKHQNHLALIDKMVYQDRVINPIVKARNLEEIFHILASYPLLGKFMAYQLVTDINYSEVVDFDENSFTIAGPGAERGINKCFIDTQGKSYADVIYWMTENQENEFQRLGLNFQSLWGRPLKAIDCQNLFCETDKYCREAFPGLKSNRKKIKAKFTPTPQPIDYFYPPKWCINDQVQETLAQRLPPLEIPNLQDNSQQLSLELDSLVKTASEISDNVSKLHKKYTQETQNKKSKALKNTELQKSQQLCLF